MATKTKKKNTTKTAATARKTTTRRKVADHEQLGAWGVIWRLVLCIGVPVGGGFLISMLTRDAQGAFNAMNQPPLAPPAWLFPVAWTILYVLMGMASFLIYYYGTRNREAAKSALVTYGIQLAFNFGWSLLFFNLKQYYLAFALLVAMWLLIIVTMVKACKVSKIASTLLIPYALWVTFAGYLNIMIAILN